MEYQKQDDQRNGNDHYRCHHGRNVFPAHAVFSDFLNAVGNQEQSRIISDESRPHVRVPAFNDLQDRDRNNGRTADRNEDLEQELQVTGSVNLGCLVQFVRNLGKVFLQQIDVEYRSNRRQDQSPEGIAHVPVGNGNEVGYDNQFVRYHHQSQETGKYQISASEFKLAEGKGRKGDDNQHESRCGQRKDDRIAQILQ